MAGPGLPESITEGVTTGHVADHEAIHDLLNEFDTTDQASTKGDLLVYSGGTIKRLPIGTDDHVLTADSAQTPGLKWAATAGGSSALDDLTDVTITTPSTGEVLKYDGSGWVNDTDATGSGLPSATTKGDIAVYDGSDWVVVAAGTNDHVLTADSAQTAGVKWAATSGGGGTGGISMPLPDLTGTDDDDWTDASLTDWTAVDPSGTSTKTAGDGILSVKYSGQSSADLAGISKSVSLSVGDSIQTGIRLVGPNSNFSMVALVMGDGNTSSDNKIAFYYQLQSNGVLFVSRGGTWAAVGSDIQLANPGIHTAHVAGWLHMRLTYQAANTFRTEISPDGISWYAPLSDSSRTLTPSTVGLGWTVWGGSTTPVASFGYFKVNT